MCAINNHLELIKNFTNMYPSELQLKKENISTSDTSFLGLSFTNENKTFKIQLYGTRDALPFSIVCMPH